MSFAHFILVKYYCIGQIVGSETTNPLRPHFMEGYSEVFLGDKTSLSRDPK
jgi:hypothetical protein